MRLAGIDLGSRAIKLAVVDENGSLLDTRIIETAFDPLGNSRKLLDGQKIDFIQATGYGRHLYQQGTDAPVVSEILAHAAGIAAWLPEVRAILDIGGQDTKAIALAPGGKVVKFEMNDRCAAGTGKFLEVMALAFGVSLQDFGEFADTGSSPASISNMCTVFAESEATSLMARGELPANIALGLHLSLAKRAATMIRRVAPEKKIAFTGGVAHNPCIRRLMAQELGVSLVIPPLPQFSGAYGAALLLRKSLVK